MMCVGQTEHHLRHETLGFFVLRQRLQTGLLARCLRHLEQHTVQYANKHFTGPIATAALVNCLSTFSGPVMMEYNFGGRPIDYLPECLDFKDGKAYMNQRPGLGVTMDMTKVKQIGEVTQPGRQNIFRRPDGSLTHW